MTDADGVGMSTKEEIKQRLMKLAPAYPYDVSNGKYSTWIMALNLFADRLAESARVVYDRSKGDGWHECITDENTAHTALLIDIQEMPLAVSQQELVSLLRDLGYRLASELAERIERHGIK